MSIRSTVRPPAVAGLFYPADTSALNRQLDDLLQRAQPLSPEGKIVALVSPHAGYMYSGLTAAHGFALLRTQRFDCVVIVSPSHREYFDGISVYGGSAYRTPLGDVPVNVEVRDQLVHNDDLIMLSDLGHGQEHAVEVQIPFLQKVLGSFTFVPVVMGDQRRAYCFHLGKKLSRVVEGKNVLLLASTDLSHYYPYDVARHLDKIIIEEIGRLDYEQLMTDLESERAEACGGGPTVAVLLAASKVGANRAYILHSCNSGDVTGDKRGVVGYVSAAVVRN